MFLADPGEDGEGGGNGEGGEGGGVEEVKRQGFRSTARLRVLRCGSLKLLFSCGLPPQKNNVAEALA